MLITDKHKIGNKLLAARKKLGMTQYEVAEAAGLSGRTYADIERGTVNMRLDTILQICQVLHVTPNEILTQQDEDLTMQYNEILKKLEQCSEKERATAFKLLTVYLSSLSFP